MSKQTDKNNINDFFKVFKVSPESGQKAVLYQEGVQAGFPSPAEDYVEGMLDLNEHFIRHPSATYVLRVNGDSMIDAGIFDGDYVVVDRSLDPVNNDIIIAFVDGEFTIKRFVKKDDKTIVLQPENINYQPIVVTSDTDFMIWGVVTGVLRKIKNI